MVLTTTKVFYYPPYLRNFSILVLLILASGRLVYADEQILDLPLDKLVNVDVESASRFKQKSSEAPSAVEVLTAENIRNYGWRTLADALNSLRGLTIRNDRNYTFLGNRGFSRGGDYNSRVLIMIDGRRMNETIFDSGFIAEEFLLDMNLIQRIEYIPGTGSSVYGANALLGIINVITKNGSDFNGFKLSGEVGSLDTYRGRATYGKKWRNGVELLLNGSHFNSLGNQQLFFPEYSGINGGIADNLDQERSSRGFGKLSYGNLTLRAGYVNRYKRVPTASFGQLFNYPYYTRDAQGYIDLDYLSQLNNKLDLELRAYHHWYDYHSDSFYNPNESATPVEPVATFDAADARWWGGEIKLTSTQFENHKWIAGLEFQYDQRQHYTNYDINPTVLYYDTNNNGVRTGAYLQDEYKLTDQLKINAGLRLDYHHLLKKLQLNPRIGLIWDVTPSLTTKLLYGSAFRAPNILEHDLNSPLSPSPQEELIKSYQAIAEWYPGQGYKLMGNLFYNDMSRVLITNSDNNSVNQGKFHTLGFELGLQKLWDNGRQVKLTWSHHNTRDDSTASGAWASDSPMNLVKAHYNEPFLNNLFTVGFEEIFVDERRTILNNIAPSYHLVNINLALTKPIHGLQASLGFYNVLDQHYKILPGQNFNQDTLTMDGRTVRFRLEYGF